MTDTLSNKYPSESVVVTFQFVDALGSETISSVSSVAASVANGVDASPSGLLNGAAVISGTDVLQPVHAGVAGVDYLLVCTIVTNSGRVLVLDAILPVVAVPAALSPRPTMRWESCGIRYALENTIAPTVEPVTLNEAKKQANVSHNDDDDLISSLITAARIEAEHQCGGRAFITSTWRLTATDFPLEFAFPVGPVQMVTSIAYQDADGVTQVLDDALYDLDLLGATASLLPAYQQTWPTIRSGRNGAQITFIAGFGNASAVPEPIKQWIKIRVATMYRDREAVLISRDQAQPLSYIDRMLDAYRVMAA